jgi:broad specificity phosphatase PhoE
VKKRIILARHGETTGNRDGMVIGRVDFPLTPEGKLMAEQIGLLIRREPVAAVFTSPLGRAVASAEIYARGTGLTIHVRSALAELACGRWDGMPRSQYLHGRGLIRENWFDAPPGGESYADAEARVQGFIGELSSEVDAECVLVVGHAGINRVFLKTLLSLGPETALRIQCPHDTIYIIHDRQILAQSPSSYWTEDFILRE